MTTTEAERQFYLARMGVTLWYARAPLPGAAPSPSLDFTEPETPDSSAGQVPSARPSGDAQSGPQPSQGSVKELLKSIGGEKRDVETPSPARKPRPHPESLSGQSPPESGATSAATDSPEPEAPAAPLTGLEHARLDLGVWSGERTCLMSAMSNDVSLDLQNQLAANILKALGETVAHTRRFVWPVFNNPRVMKNAGRDLSTLVTGLSDELVAGRRLVVLGQVAEREHERDELLAKVASDSIACPDSLAALAADPDKKRELWRRLQEQVLEGR